LKNGKELFGNKRNNREEGLERKLCFGCGKWGERGWDWWVLGWRERTEADGRVIVLFWEGKQVLFLGAGMRV
jgi:hypothetical protein